MGDDFLLAGGARLAVESEELVAVRFGGGPMALTSVREILHSGPVTHVCIPPGALLLLEHVPEPLQRELGVSGIELVTLTQSGLRDGLRFDNGREVLIQRLHENQRVIVLSLNDNTEPVERSGEVNASALESLVN